MADIPANTRCAGCKHLAMSHRNQPGGKNTGPCAMANCDCDGMTSSATAAVEPDVFGAIGVASGPTSTTDGPWDGPANEAKLPNDNPAAYRKMYAWADPKGDPAKKSSYKFPHHTVAAGGSVGAANTTACSSGLAVLNGGRGGSSIPPGDKPGVWSHLAAHLKAAGKDVPDKKFSADGEQMAAGDGQPLADGTIGQPAGPDGIPWTATLILEGVETSDGRYVQPGALTWRELPQSLMVLTVTGEGHDGAQVGGRIDNITRIDRGDGTNAIQGQGVFDTGGPVGLEAARLVGTKTLRGVSADMAISDAIVADPFDDKPDDGPSLTVVAGELLGATVCPMPAFAGCTITLDDATTTPAEPAPDAPRIATHSSRPAFETVQDDTCLPCTEAREDALVASSVPVAPPAEWFTDPGLDGPTAVEVTDDGRIYGHLACWGVCHTGQTGACILAPHSATNYAWFRTGCVQCADGSRVATGRLTMGTGHAPMSANMAAAAEHYDNTGTAVADVACGEDAFGIWMAGALRPDVTPERMRALRGSDVSGDWRRVGAGLELRAALAVNVGAYPTQRPMARVASGTPLALVAAGIPAPAHSGGSREWAAVREEIAALRRDRQADRLLARIGR